MIVLSLCDRTGVMVQPWRADGFECWIVDLQHEARERRIGRMATAGKVGGDLVVVGADVRTWLPPRAEYAACFAFPPCTHLANSGNRWKAEKGLGALAESLTLVDACRRICEWTGAPWCLENPVGSLSTYWRKPDYTFHPWHYGTPESKRTCLWTGGGFVMPPYEQIARPADTKETVFRMPPSEDRGDLRSVTDQRFAEAVYRANVQRLELTSVSPSRSRP